MKRVVKEIKLRDLSHGSMSDTGGVTRARHRFDIEVRIRRTEAWAYTHFPTPPTPPTPPVTENYRQLKVY